VGYDGANLSRQGDSFLPVIIPPQPPPTPLNHHDLPLLLFASFTGAFFYPSSLLRFHTPLIVLVRSSVFSLAPLESHLLLSFLPRVTLFPQDSFVYFVSSVPPMAPRHLCQFIQI